MTPADVFAELEADGAGIDARHLARWLLRVGRPVGLRATPLGAAEIARARVALREVQRALWHAEQRNPRPLELVVGGRRQ